MRILHILRYSLPYISGSTIRSKYIFKYQKKFAKIFVLTSFLFNEGKSDLDIIEGIPYFRIKKRLAFFLRNYYYEMERIANFLYKHLGVQIGEKLQNFIISPFIKRYIETFVRFYKIDIIHAHTTHQIAKFAIEIAKKRNIPFIYEVRGFIEKNLLINVKNSNRKEFKLLAYKYKKIKDIETKLMNNSDIIITLSEPMKQEIVKRNIDEKKIKVIPNCTDTNLFQPIVKNETLINRYNLTGQNIIGYIGRINKYEGIEVLFKAIPFIIKKYENIKVLIIGGISLQYFKYLKSLINKLKISKYIIFLGLIPHNEINQYYSIIDIIVLPRINSDLNRIVTPLKPIEAMAFKKLVIASDLPALRSTIIPKKTGDLFIPEDPLDLASKIVYYLKNPNLKQEIENYSQKYIEENFLWEKTVPIYKKIYNDLIRSY